MSPKLAFWVKSPLYFLTSPVLLCWTVVKYAYLMSVLENSGENQNKNQNARFFVISHNDPASNPNCAIWGWQALFSADQDKMPTWVITKLQLFNLEEIRLTRLESCHSESACEHFHAFQHKLSRKWKWPQEWKWLQECNCFGPFPCLPTQIVQEMEMTSRMETTSRMEMTSGMQTAKQFRQLSHKTRMLNWPEPKLLMLAPKVKDTWRNFNKILKLRLWGLKNGFCASSLTYKVSKPCDHFQFQGAIWGI